MSGGEGATFREEKGLGWGKGLQGQKVKTNRGLVTRAWWWQWLGGMWWSPAGQFGSGQFQELLQCVLFHSLHEELIVLGEGRQEVVT